MKQCKNIIAKSKQTKYTHNCLDYFVTQLPRLLCHPTASSILTNNPLKYSTVR